MPGDEWQRFANLRAYYGFMWCHPGKKLLFMGGEFAQSREWNHDTGLDWHLLEFGYHSGVRALVRDLNRLYAATPALHELDCEAEGFEWIDADDRDASVFSFVRRGRQADALVVVVSNFTPVVRRDVRLGVPAAGLYRTVFNTDAECYGGSGVTPGLPLATEAIPHGRHEHSLVVTLPPLATVALAREPAGT
jgi:1,4-alpha-glucan branching enzyme